MLSPNMPKTVLSEVHRNLCAIWTFFKKMGMVRTNPALNSFE